MNYSYLYLHKYVYDKEKHKPTEEQFSFVGNKSRLI